METESPYPCDKAENGTAVPDPNFRPEDAQHEGKSSRGSPCSCGDILLALLSRLVFMAHGLVSGVWVVVTMPWQHHYSVFIAAFALMLVETLVTIICRKGRGYKWFSPIILFYLLTIVPCVWVIELDALQQRMNFRDNLDHDVTNFTQHVAHDTNATFDNAVEIFDGLTVPTLAPDEMTMVVEQLLIFILILGRWMLPKGEITRDELSQLLLTYIALGADIVELFSVFEEETVAYDHTLTLVILAIWSASLTQFTIVSTAKIQRPGDEQSDSSGGCCTSEVFGILIAMILQDLPFLGLRLLMLTKYNTFTYLNIFFTVKNLLVILLTIYRLAILICCPDTDPLETADSHDAEKMA